MASLFYNKSILKKTTSVSISSYICILFIIIFISDDTFNFGTNDNTFFILFKYTTYLLLTIYVLNKSKKRHFSVLTRGNGALILILTAILLTAALNLDFRAGYIYQFWIIFLAYLISNYIPTDELVRIYVKYIFVLSNLSIAVYVLAVFFYNILSIFPVYTNSNNVEFYNLGFCVVFKDVGIIRNTGIFREPGVYMIYLSLAILFELFYKSKINKLHLISFLVSLITTFSTAAIIIFFVICIAFLFKENITKEIIYNKALIILLGGITLSIIVFSPDINSMVFDKLGKDSVGEGSSLARGASVFVNYNIFINNPIAGCGITQYADKFAAYSRQLFHISLDTGNNTNMIMTVFAVYGSLLGVILLLCILRMTKQFSQSSVIRAILFIGFLMLLSNEDLRYSLMIFVLLFWGLKKRELLIKQHYTLEGNNI